MFRLRLRLPILTTLCLLCITPAAQAWNATGHEVIAEIAWRNLKPAVRDKVLNLLKQHPHFAKHLEPAADATAVPTDYALRVFMRAATWPDLMRSAKGKEREFHHGEWHYIDFPIVVEGTDKNTLEIPPIGEKLEPGKPPQNILQALEWCIERLKNPDAPADEKALALAWLEHLVGDIHQPLHCCSLFSADYPKGDRGGNLFMIKYHCNSTRLHAYWDELLGGYMSFRLVDAVADKVIEKHPRASLEKELAVTKFPDWARESFAIARDVAYWGGQLKGVTQDVSIADGSKVPDLPEKYDQLAHETGRQRVALAGYRLAEILNQLFDAP